MKFFSHKQKKHELKTESEEDLSVEDIIAEYQARQDVEAQQAPEPDGRDEYYSSSQGGYDEYYDSQSFQPEPDYGHEEYNRQDYSDYVPTSDGDIDRIFEDIFADYYGSTAAGEQGQESKPSKSGSSRGGQDYGYSQGSSPRSGNIGAMEREAREYISHMQMSEPSPGRAPLSQEELYAPLREDELARTRKPKQTGDSSYNPEIDSRFNLSGHRESSGYQFGSRSVDMSADDSSLPPPRPTTTSPTGRRNTTGTAVKRTTTRRSWRVRGAYSKSAASPRRKQRSRSLKATAPNMTLFPRKKMKRTPMPRVSGTTALPQETMPWKTTTTRSTAPHAAPTAWRMTLTRQGTCPASRSIWPLCLPPPFCA
ncbi:MAG: hypothetical protein V8T45_08020 [Oscillospiraceae bacterium]